MDRFLSNRWVTFLKKYTTFLKKYTTTAQRVTVWCGLNLKKEGLSVCVSLLLGLGYGNRKYC